MGDWFFELPRRVEHNSEPLNDFLLPDHLTQRGEAWLVVSDLPELLGLRDPGTLPALVSAAGLVVLDRLTVSSTTRGLPDDDPLAPLRGRETVALWRLGR